MAFLVSPLLVVSHSGLYRAIDGGHLELLGSAGLSLCTSLLADAMRVARSGLLRLHVGLIMAVVLLLIVVSMAV